MDQPACLTMRPRATSMLRALAAQAVEKSSCLSDVFDAFISLQLCASSPTTSKAHRLSIAYADRPGVNIPLEDVGIANICQKLGRAWIARPHAQLDLQVKDVFRISERRVPFAFQTAQTHFLSSAGKLASCPSLGPHA